MSSRAVNLGLLTLLVLEFVSGVASYLVGTPAAAWVFWVHRIAGFAIVALLAWKVRIVANAYRRRGLRGSTALSGVLGLLFLTTLGFGLLWATTGVRGAHVPVLGSLTGLGVHVLLAVSLLPLLGLHIVARWSKVRARRPDFASRRAVLRYAALATTGSLLWQGSECVAAAAGWSGARRRFTGSRQIGSYGGNAFPATNWLSDPKPRIDATTWWLRLHGLVAGEVTFTFADLETLPAASVRATLDCTGGWYTVQVWRGVPVAALLATASPTEDARSIVVRSVTGYTRRYPIDEVGRLLLATHVGDELLSRGHGYPARLVAPGRRGYDWVKWVVAIEVSDLPAWFQSPLPLQ